MSDDPQPLSQTGKTPADHRVHALDALRGIAALVVLYAHILYVYGTKEIWIAAARRGEFLGLLLARTPLGMFFSGGEAVIIFFILSGFVLALPFLAGTPPRYGAFAIRRFFRIYPPYAFALLVAVVARILVAVVPVAGISSWFAAFWAAPVTLKTIAGYLAMTGFPEHTTIDFVVWSLIHEMRISLIFPLLFAATCFGRPWLRLAAFFTLSYVCACLSVRLAPTQQGLQTLLQTGSYVWFFVIGIELARHRRAVTLWIQSRGRIVFAALLSLAACFYGARLIFPALGFRPESDFIVGIGAAGFVAFAFGRARFERWLSWPPFLFLGRISYSLYLLHPIVLLTFVYALHGVLSREVMLIVMAPASVLVAWAGQRFVEEPSMRLGRALARRTLARHAPPKLKTA